MANQHKDLTLEDQVAVLKAFAGAKLLKLTIVYAHLTDIYLALYYTTVFVL